MWTFTAAVGAPRIAAIEHPSGRILGQPGDAETQTAILKALLGSLQTIEEPGGVAHLPFRWTETRWATLRQGKQRVPPIARLIMKKPWLLRRLISGQIPK